MKQPFYYMIIGLDIKQCLSIANKIYDSYKKKNLPINIETNIDNVCYCLSNKINVLQPICAISIKDRKQVLDKLRKIKCNKICIINNTKISDYIKTSNYTMQEGINYISRFQFPLQSEGFKSIKIFMTNTDLKTNSFKRELVYDEIIKKQYLSLFNYLSILNNESEIWKESIIFKNIATVIYNTDSLNTIEQNNLSAYYILSNPDIINNCTIKNLIAIVHIINYFAQCNPSLDVKITKKWEKMLGKRLFNELKEFYLVNELLR